MRVPLRAPAFALALVLIGSGQALAQAVNTPWDSNGNGTLDRVIVEGDYDGDGIAEPEDIQAALNALSGRLPGEAGLVEVRFGIYRELCRGDGDPLGYCFGDPHIACTPVTGVECQDAGLLGPPAICRPIDCLGWDVRPYAGTGDPRGSNKGLIDLGADDADLTLACDPGTRIEGIWNKRRFDGTSPPPGAAGMGGNSAKLLSVTGTHDVTVTGCDMDGGIPRGLGAFDPVAKDWPLVADGGTATTLVDADPGWRDGEWRLWWVMLRPGCDGPQAPHAWCSGAEEFVQILSMDDASDTLGVAGFAQAPQAGDRYVILYHSGGVCTDDPTRDCLQDSQCPAGSCDLSVEDDPLQGRRQTVYVSAVERVSFENVRVSGSSHAGFYAKNSRGVDLVDSEVLESGGYYGHGHSSRWPSIYLFSGVPDPPCFEGGTDCRLLDARIENTEIHHSGTAVNLRWAPQPGRQMYIEGLRVLNNPIHDLFSADGSAFPGILCSGKDALCEGNVVERARGGFVLGGNVDNGWPSETPLPGNTLNEWQVRVRNNVIRDLFWMRGASAISLHGIYGLHGNEELVFEDNHVERVGVAATGPLMHGTGLVFGGPNRSVKIRGLTVEDASYASLRIGNLGAEPAPPGLWREWVELEASGEDLGPDPAGFASPRAFERLEVLQRGRVTLSDERDDGQRGGIGGAAEALYVRTLVFGDSDSLLNLNGIHLYYETLLGDPAQILDLPSDCPDGELHAGEACDDANNTWGDGCSPGCRLEQEVTLWGVAEGGGSVALGVDGQLLSVPTTPLQNARDLLVELAEAVLADAQLQAAGTEAAALDNRLVVSGTIESWVVSDAGLAATLPRLPALGPGPRLLIAVAIPLLGGLLLARRYGAGR